MELKPLPAGFDHFQRLGLESDYRIDREQIEERYLNLSRGCHPDRFVNAAPAQRRLALEHTAALNEAYEVLRDRVKRAEYLVKLGGIDLDSSEAVGGAPTPSQAFLIEMIEAREELGELSASQRFDELEGLRERVEAQVDADLQEAVSALEAKDIPAAAQALVARRYHQRLLDEVEDCLDRE